MKKIILPLLLLSTVSFSQTINGKNLKEIKSDYVRIIGASHVNKANCEMNGEQTKISCGRVISIDFDRKQNVLKGEDDILDVNGCSVNLGSVIEAFDFMCNSGYEFVTASSTIVGDKNVYQYLLKRK